MSNLNKLEFYKLFNIDKINFNESDLKKVKKKKKKTKTTIIKKKKKKKKKATTTIIIKKNIYILLYSINIFYKKRK